MNKLLPFIFVLSSFYSVQCQHNKAISPIPSQAQLQWHKDGFYLFIHFGPNTFTDKEWGDGDEKTEIFNPSKLDTKQWCRIAKEAGAVGIIITAKHHDGFCLWPSDYSTHTVRESKWREGKGDVLKELSTACKEYNLKFGVYLSPWDRNHPQYGTPEYNQVFVNMMTEIFINYGPIWEFWWDGANGEGPNGKTQVYDWPLFRKTVKDLSPSTVVFSDVGPDIRWVGNEKGIAGETNWNLLNTEGFTPGIGAPSTDILNSGEENGANWIPAECDVSIRPGWFYHKEEDEKVKSPKELFSLYLKSVGRGANLLLNVPPDRRGLFTQYDSTALVGFKKLREENFKNDLLKECMIRVSGMTTEKLNDNDVASYEVVAVKEGVVISFSVPTAINTFQISETIEFGQFAKSFAVLLIDNDDVVIKELKGTTIGHKRILTFPTVVVSSIELVILDSNTTVFLSNVSAFRINDNLIE